MKTAISLPDRLYEEAEKTAEIMGLPRSQLFAKALEEFIEHHKRENITEKLNSIYSHLNEKSDLFTDNVGIDSMRNLTKNDTW